ncbi:MAG: (d)CMP kinase [Pseudomonadota bacterium]
MNAPVLTIDGPSGSGKGTISRRLAGLFEWHLLDSGALYRLAGLAGRRNGVSLEDARGIASLATSMDVKFEEDAEGNERILFSDEDVTRDIRSETCGEDASRVASLPEVREALFAFQQSFCRPPGLVADGRDMGTQIFPDAPLKVFLTASAQERADRRYKQLKDKDIDVSLAALLQDIERRDARDASRAVAPLVPADDAYVIDSTNQSIDEVVAEVVELKNRIIGIG